LKVSYLNIFKILFGLSLSYILKTRLKSIFYNTDSLKRNDSMLFE